MRCCVPGCGQRSEKGISLHKFPNKEPGRVKEWVDAIVKFLNDNCYAKKCFIPKTNYVVCSKHFSLNDYLPVKDGRPMLKISASPSIFLCDPNAKRGMKSKENVVTSTLRKIAPKPVIKNIENNSTAKSLSPGIVDINSNSHELAVPLIGTAKIDSQEPNCMCSTPTRKATITKVRTPFTQNAPEVKSDRSTTPIRLDASVTTEFSNDDSENCAGCSSLKREIETLRAENIALQKLVATLKEEKRQGQTASDLIETLEEESVSHADVDVFSSTPTSCRVLDKENASEEQDSVPLLQRIVRLDHRYESTPQTLKRKLQSSESQKKSIAKKARITTQKLKRTELKVAEMKQMMKALVEKVDLRPEVATHIEKVFGSVPLELYKRCSLIHSAGKKKVRKQYSASLRAFAVTLHFYSPRAYDFVREQFGLGLPHASTIRGWYHEIQCEPGFTENSFSALEVKANEYSAANKTLCCAMMFDDMHLKKQVEWDGTKYHGFCHIGEGTSHGESEVEAATQALVIMVVGLDASWKVPLGYFFHKGLVASKIADLVTQCLQRLHCIGIKVASVTFDGPSAHFAMARLLGANLSTLDLRSSFPHPCDATIPVYCLLDPCHVLKLVRGAWSDSKVLHDSVGRCIDWRFIENLHHLQDSEGLRAGNKLRNSHLQWKKSPMKVNLAAQTLSSSVADAIDFCRDAGMVDFKGSEATTHFIRIIDRWFDIMNSRNPIGRGFKAPLSTNNEWSWRPFLHEIASYINSLRLRNGQACVTSPKKTGFIGVVLSCESVRAIFDTLVVSPDTHFKYLLTYKLSQDHLELFFNAIRARGGWCVNPSPRHFSSAYKRLLVRHQIKASNGNVDHLDRTSILFVTRNSVVRYQDTVAQLDTLSTALNRAYSTEDDTTEVGEGDPDKLDTLPMYSDRPQALQDDLGDSSSEMPPNYFVLSEFAENAVAFIAGYVIRMVFKRIKCLICCGVLCSGEPTDNRLRLILQKSNGGLILPSPDVVKICSITELIFRRVSRGIPPTTPGFNHSVANMVFADLADKNLFRDLTEHMFDTSAEENHMFNLIKTIALCYIRIKMFHEGKNYTELISDPGKRKKLSRLAIFLNV